MPRCRDTAIFVVTTDKPITLHARGVISRDGRTKKYTNRSIVGIITDEIHPHTLCFWQWLEVRQRDLVGRARGPAEILGNFLRKKTVEKNVKFQSSAGIEPGTSSSTVQNVTSKPSGAAAVCTQNPSSI